VLLALTLITLDLALLGNAEIQSVSGFEELQGGPGFDFRWLYPVAALLGAGFVWHQRRTDDPLIDPGFFRSANLRIALLVNFIVGAALIIAMVDVPIFVNAIEVDLERSAVIAGWILAALTAAMAAASWLGGRLSERLSYRPPTVIGMAFASIALLAMGFTWSPDLNLTFGAAQLALLGAGLGLVFAPTTATVVDASPPSQRGAAAAIVMIVRLMGLSVGLAGLTAWGLGRFNELRQQIELPPITDPDFQAAITDASATLTADAISETFLAAAVVTAVGAAVAVFLRTPTGEEPMAEDVRESSWMKSAVIGLGIGLIGTLLGLVFVVRSLNNTQDDLAQAQADLVRVEEAAAGSAIVSAQVLEITRQIGELEPEISAGLDQAIAELESFSNSSIEFDVAVDETVQIDTSITIDRDFNFPVDETIVIDESVPINETIETTVRVDTGVGFSIPVDIEVPVDVDVPIQLEVPIDLDVDVPINETVPVSAEVPVKIDVPINIDIAETDLKTLADQLAAGLRDIKEVVNDLAG